MERSTAASRTRCRERLPRRACDRPGVDRSHPEGNGRSRERINSANIASDCSSNNCSPINENPVSLDTRKYSSKKSSGTPIKTLISEEMSKEMEIRQPSPSLVARLMGLDTLPHQQFSKGEPNEKKSYFQKTSSLEFQQKYSLLEDHSLRKSTDEHQDFKDVFEIIETTKAEKYKKQQLGRRNSSWRQTETDMALIRQKFMDAKRLSADETLHQSKDFNDALEVLDSNKDLFLKLLEKPNSLFTKHIRDLKCIQPPSHVSHITILKSSKDSKNEGTGTCCKSNGNAKRCTNMQREVKGSSGKEAKTLTSHCDREHISHKLPKANNAGKFGACSTPTRIVVLKPSLQKAQDMATVSLSRSHADIELVYRRNKGNRKAVVQESYAEGRGRMKASDDMEVEHRKGSREIAREITEQMRNILTHRAKKASALGRDMLSYSDEFKSASSHFDSFSCSSSYSAETLVSREARKRLSERWRTTNQCLEAGFVRGSRTLGEMLALSDKEVPGTAMDPFSTRNSSAVIVPKAEVGLTWDRPSGISSRDGWKEARSGSLPRSVSLPSSSTMYDIPKPGSVDKPVGRSRGLDDSLGKSFCRKGSSSRKSYKFHRHKPHLFTSGEENRLVEREIHVTTEELGNTFSSHLAEEELITSQVFEDTVGDKEYLVPNSSLAENNDLMIPIMIKESETLGPTDPIALERSPQSIGYDHKDTESIMLEGASYGNSVSPVNTEETEQPSPVSVLEPPSEEEISSSGCFGKISADLKELRMQLRLLKMDSAETDAGELELAFSSDENTGGAFDSLPEMEEMVQTFKDEDDREFFYLFDLLSESGFQRADWNNLSDAYHSLECPVCPDLFSKLEKKYSINKSWSRSDRKLLFDLTNLVLVEIGSPSVDLHHWVKPKRRFCSTLSYEALVKEVLQMLVQHRKELSSSLEKVLEPKWFHTGNSANFLGRELEEMVLEDLLEELVSEAALG